ncbi:MAG: hypothetical protein ACJ8ER_17655 [Allosphingosinicella sp.]
MSEEAREAGLDLERRVQLLERAQAAALTMNRADSGDSRSTWTSPLLLTVTTGLLGIFGALVANYWQAKSDYRLEQERNQSSLILKAIETGNPEAASKNLLFLLDLGLIQDRTGKIAQLRAAPQNAPVLPASGQGAAVKLSEPGMEVFFRSYRREFGALSPSSEANLRALFDYVAKDNSLNSLRKVAYVLATIKDETQGTFEPREEVGSPEELERKYGNRASLGNSHPGDGYRYRGRGYILFTGRANYAKSNQLLGLGGTPDDLVEHPERALDPVIAYRMASEGMREMLDKYVTASGYDHVQLRRGVFGGLDNLAQIRADTGRFEKVLTEALAASRRGEAPASG